METAAQDRRSRRTVRVPFEALVIIAGQAGNVGAYECEATDVSEQGIHLRTAYLPDVGKSVTCRFDTGIDEVVAEGVVAWRQEAARGGEFGIQFTRLDERSIIALRELCGTLEPESPSEVAASPGSLPANATANKAPEFIPAKTQASEPPVTKKESKPNAVKIHLDGISGPMSAQVRTTKDGQVLVGSHLKALKVGHQVEIEDTSKQGRRPAIIDRVAVEVNAETQVPELVVALRYNEPKSKAESKDSPPATTRAESGSSQSKIPLSSKSPASTGPSSKNNPAPVSSKQPSKKAPVEEEISAKNVENDDESSPNDKAGFDIWKQRAQTMASQMGSQMASAGSKAKETVMGWVELVKAHRANKKDSDDDVLGNEADLESGRGHSTKAAAERDAHEAKVPPTRTARASAPTQRREQGDSTMDEFGDSSESSEITPKKNMAPRALALGGAAVAALLIGFFALRGKGAEPNPPPGADAPIAAEAAAPPALPAGPAQRNAMPGNNGQPQGDAVVANVPLFGATPLSTTEPAPGAPPQPAAIPAGQAPQAGLPAPGAPSGDMGDDDGPVGDKKAPSTTYGRGEVVKPRTIRLKMDAPITDIRGVVEGNTIKLTLPGRRNIEAANVLTKRDKRLASVKAIPGAEGVEVQITFKDKVPPFLARANTKMLEIDLGKEGEGGKSDAVASGSKKSKKHGTSANKGKADKHDQHKAKGKNADKAKAKKPASKHKKNNDD